MGLESSSALTAVVPELGLVEHWVILREEQKSRVEKKKSQIKLLYWLLMKQTNHGIS